LNSFGVSRFYGVMKWRSGKVVMAALLAAGIAMSVGCYPAYPPAAYMPPVNEDAKGDFVPPEPAPAPSYTGIDPALVVAGAAAAGLLGYAIGSNHGHHHYSYWGPAYYRPVPYWRGYYAPGYCR
jgi:hypothetical protein